MKLLVINPGATSTKFALYLDKNPLLEAKVEHTQEELKQFRRVFDQFAYRRDLIQKAIEAKGEDLFGLDAVVARGGLLRPIESGTYEINDRMLSDLKNCVVGEHASNLGAAIAHDIALKKGIPSYIVDPICVDELSDVARVSGHPEFERVSLFHALNQKAVARKAAERLGREYSDLNLIVVHLGTGISIAAHKKGRAVEMCNVRDDGPFCADRCGGLPSYQLVKLCYSGKYTFDQMKEMLSSKGGIYAYLGTKDLREVEGRIDAGDKKAALVYDAFVYRIAKEIGSYFVVLEGKVDRIVLTGGMAYSERLTKKIADAVGFLSPVEVVPGEDELEALALGALRVLTGEERAKIYA